MTFPKDSTCEEMRLVVEGGKNYMIKAVKPKNQQLEDKAEVKDLHETIAHLQNENKKLKSENKDLKDTVLTRDEKINQDLAKEL